MQIFCNGERVSVEVDQLAAVVDALGYGDRAVAVAVNETFVAKADWPRHQVHADDRLDILSAMQGG